MAPPMRTARPPRPDRREPKHDEPAGREQERKAETHVGRRGAQRAGAREGHRDEGHDHDAGKDRRQRDGRRRALRDSVDEVGGDDSDHTGRPESRKSDPGRRLQADHQAELRQARDDRCGKCRADTPGEPPRVGERHDHDRRHRQRPDQRMDEDRGRQHDGQEPVQPPRTRRQNQPLAARDDQQRERERRQHERRHAVTRVVQAHERERQWKRQQRPVRGTAPERGRREPRHRQPR